MKLITPGPSFSDDDGPDALQNLLDSFLPGRVFKCTKMLVGSEISTWLDWFHNT